jgi:hypothetical protein
MNVLIFVPPLPEPETMKKCSFVALCIAIVGNSAATADEMAADAAVQRVVASIRADAASESDCVADDDSQRFRAAPVPLTANRGSASALAAAAHQNRVRLARIERQLRSPSVTR